jgi:hypothetical protein
MQINSQEVAAVLADFLETSAFVAEGIVQKFAQTALTDRQLVIANIAIDFDVHTIQLLLPIVYLV